MPAFKKQFIRVRPKWLVTEDGGRLELDGYCEELHLAFEHQGGHHKKVVTKFGGTEERLRAQMARDAEKKAICSARDITLIEIPEVPREVQVPDLRGYILGKCKEKGVRLLDDAERKPVDLREAYSVGPLQRLRSTASERGGALVTEHFEGYNRRHTWRCAAGHTWPATPSSVIYQGTWCPYCGRRRAKYTNPEFQALAASRGGHCLSTEYAGAHSPIQWQCARGHTWFAALTNVVRGSWCPICARTGLHTHRNP